MPGGLRRMPATPTEATIYVPAPVGGLNYVSAGGVMPAGDCPRLWNMVASEMGLRSRLGSREWCTGLTGAADNLTRQLLPFSGSTASNSRLFATTSSGIWDVTASSAAPSMVLTFADDTGNAGYGVCHGMVNAAGNHFLLYCDEQNGYHVYSETAGTWAAVAMGAGATEVNGVDPATLVHVVVHKGRVWLTQRDTAKGWYLPLGAPYGTATAFNFGQQFRAGGALRGLYSWTIDGGAGADDSLVAVSDGGDLTVWRGTDPAAAATWAIQGVWFAGAIPAGRRIVTNRGGQAQVLTRAGILPLSRLVAGASIEDREQYATYKVQALFNQLMLTQAELIGWSMLEHPEDHVFVVTVPQGAGMATKQLAASLSGASWGEYRDLPIYSSEVWGGKLYFGTTDGRVCINDGYVDGVSLADPGSYTAVQWSLITAFGNLGNGRKKLVKRIRTTIISETQNPAYKAEARFGYDLREVAPVTASPPGDGEWDAAEFDSGVWGGEYTASQRVTGLVGCGTDVAIAIRGAATGRTILVGMDVTFEQGGTL